MMNRYKKVNACASTKSFNLEFSRESMTDLNYHQSEITFLKEIDRKKCCHAKSGMY